MPTNAAMAMTPSDTPTPMPALAPEDSPLSVDASDVEELVCAGPLGVEDAGLALMDDVPAVASADSCCIRRTID